MATKKTNRRAGMKRKLRMRGSLRACCLRSILRQPCAMYCYDLDIDLNPDPPRVEGTPERYQLRQTGRIVAAKHGDWGLGKGLRFEAAAGS